MKIIIDIDENVFTRLFDNGIQDNEIAVDDVCEMARSIRKGIPLEEELENSDVNGLKIIAECSECHKRIDGSGNCLLLEDTEVKFVNFDYAPNDCPLKENK